MAAFHVGKVPPAIPSIREDLGAGLREAGWLLSLVNLIAAVGGMTIALTVDRFGHRRLVILGTAAALCVLAFAAGAWVAAALHADRARRVVEGGTTSEPVLVSVRIDRAPRPPERDLNGHSSRRNR